MILDTVLNQLETTDLVRRLNEGDLAYLIKHALVQDTACASLLRQDRRRLHRVVGEALETLYPERRDEFAALLAQHFADAGDNAKTLEYLQLAGEVATRVNANYEALEHFTRASALAEEIHAPVALRQELFLKRGRILEVLDQIQAALKIYTEMQQNGDLKQEPALELAGLMAAATLHSIPSSIHDDTRAQTLSDRALALAQTLHDRAAQAKILWNLMLLYSRADTRFRQATEFGERALVLARAEQQTELVAYLLNDLSPTYSFLGNHELARAYNLEARGMWLERNNIPMLTDNLGYAVMIHLFSGEYQPAIDAAQEALRHSRAINNLWGEAFAQSWVGVAYWELGDITGAIEIMENALVAAESSFPAPLVVTRSDLARLFVEFGDKDRALVMAEQAMAKAIELFPAMKSWAQGALGFVHLKRGEYDLAFEAVCDVPLDLDPDTTPFYEWVRIQVYVELFMAKQEYEQARALCHRVLAHLTMHNLRLHLFAFQILAARIHIALGETDAAFQVLTNAHNAAQGQNARWSLWQILGLMAQVQEKRGQPEQANESRTAARAVIAEIGARTPETLRAGFLERVLCQL